MNTTATVAPISADDGNDRLPVVAAPPLRSGLLTAVVCALWWVPPAWSQRPAAPKLLPDRTLAYVRVHDTREFVEKYKRTQFGRVLQDEKVRPFFEDLFESFRGEFEKAELESKIGVSVDRLLAIPQGELCVALVDPGVYESSNTQPVLIAILDVGKGGADAESVLAAVVGRIEGEGGTKETEAFGETMLTVVTPSGSQIPWVYFIREGTLVATSDVEAAKDIIQTWDGISETRKLAENRKFASILRRSRGTRDERPQLAWYADPMLFLRTAAKNDTGLQATLLLFPLLGIDGIKAIGGSMILDTEEFESLQHIHLMLDSPRRGLLKLVEFQTGDGDPEPWVPADASTYMSAYFDFPAAFAEADRVVSRVRGEGALLRMAESRFAAPLGLDFQKDVLDQWGGRITFLNWVESPDKVNHQANLLAIQLKDPKAFRSTLKGVINKFTDSAKTARFRQVTYFRFESRMARRRRERTGSGPPEFVREPTPCVAVVGDSLIVCDSEPCLKAAITAMATGKSLGQELDFKLIQSRIRTHLGTDKPSLIAFTRPEETLRGIYQLAVSPKFREQIQGREHPVAQALLRAMKNHPLPPYAEIAKYFAPAGGVMVQDASGLHYMAFGLKRGD